MTAHILFFLHSTKFKVNIFRSRRHVNVDGFIVNPHPCGSLEDSMSKVYRRVCRVRKTIFPPLFLQSNRKYNDDDDYCNS